MTSLRAQLIYEDRIAIAEAQARLAEVTTKRLLVRARIVAGIEGKNEGERESNRRVLLSESDEYQALIALAAKLTLQVALLKAAVEQQLLMLQHDPGHSSHRPATSSLLAASPVSSSASHVASPHSDATGTDQREEAPMD